MKLFIRNIIRFCLVLMILWLLHILLLIFVVQIKPAKYTLYHLNAPIQHKKYFILGNSHSQCALNDTLLGPEFLNVSKSAEPLFYTCIKAQNIIDQVKPDTLIIQLDNSALCSIHWALANNRLVENYQNYFSLMTLKDHRFLFEHNFVKSLRSILFLTIKDIINYKNIDGYAIDLPVSQNGDTTIIYDDKKTDGVGKYSVDTQHKNLDALTELIKRNPSTTFFITRMPMNKRVQLFHETYFKDYVTTLKKFKNCIYYDFHNKIVLPDSCFFDLQHLNYDGMKVFNGMFRKVFVYGHW